MTYSKKKRKRQRNRSTKPLKHRTTESLEPRLVMTGTPVLIDLNAAGASSPSDFVQVGEIAFFVAEDAMHGRELWRTDGQDSGTFRVADIGPGSDSSNPQELLEFDGKLFFTANDGQNGAELWMSDGTEAGTALVRDIHEGEGYQYPYGDGPFQSVPRSPAVLDGQLFFDAEDADFGRELWKTDGTEAGTQLVRDIFPGSYTDPYGTYPNYSKPENLVAANGTLFFTAVTEDAGRELWKSDGSEAGTMLVRDISPGTYPYEFAGQTADLPNASNPRQLTVMNGEVYFMATTVEHGTELWKSDGTEAGTMLVKDIRAGAEDGLYDVDSMTVIDGTLLLSANDGISGTELWKSDGTTDGTELVKDIRPGSESSLALVEFAEQGNRVFFAANDGSRGAELWQSDGTASGTQLVADIHASAASSSPSYLTAVDGRVFFSADDGTTGRELWETDGTAAGTSLVSDLAVGADSSDPAHLFDLHGTALFSATTNGEQELWVVDATATAAAVVSARLTVYVESTPIAIPLHVGVAADGSPISQIRTTSANGDLEIGSIAGESRGSITVGDFFETWQNNAGVAGNNAASSFDGSQVLGNEVDASNTLQMFVNGELSEAFANYVIQENDQIVVVYGDNPVVSVNTNFGAIVIELFEEETPGTVDNFLTYVNDGDYLNTFFHRSADSGGNDFVIQGGGFATTSTSFTSVDQFTRIATDPPIVNEPGISNLRGTVAMAKTSDPDSATSQFFVNLNDSNTFLDSPSNSGGFTVFGQVLDMTNADTIAALPIDSNNPSPYGELPLGEDDTLVVVQAVEGIGTVSGINFLDTNGNGNLDAGEQPITDAVVFADINENGSLDAGESSVTTDADGRYLLPLAPGNYTLATIPTSGQTTTSPTNGTHAISVELGRQISNLDFGQGVATGPTTVVLLPTSDTGNDDDRITSFNNSNANTSLSFEVFGATADAELRLYANDVLVGTGVATSGRTTITTDSINRLAEGLNVIQVTQLIGGNESDPSSSLELTIDAVVPEGIGNTAPAVAQVGETYFFDATSSEESNGTATYSLASAPAGMTIDSATGVVEWVPTAEQVEPQQIEVTVADPAGNTASRLVSVTVLDEVPAFPDAYSLLEDGVLTIDAANGVLANDGDAQTGNLTASLVSPPSDGTVTFNADGSFEYQPSPDFFGEDEFRYRAFDGQEESNIAIVSIRVDAVNDQPIATNDAYVVNEDEVLDVGIAAGLLANDADADMDELATSVLSPASHGTIQLNSDGTFSYTPDDEFFGTDTFTYEVSDGDMTSNIATVTIDVAEINDAPDAVSDAYTAVEDTSLTVDAATGLLSNDSDAEGDALTADLGSQPDNGVVTLNADGSFIYTANPDFFGTDSFTYTVSDGNSSSEAVMVTVAVEGQGDAPTAVDDDVAATNDETTQTFDVLANDNSDPDENQALTLESVSQGSSGGIVVINGDQVDYTAPIGFVGTDTFTYTIQDTDGLTDTAMVNVTVREAASNVISGVVYLDRNGDGTQDADEIGVPGASVTLTGNDLDGEAITRELLTADDGSYRFEELPSGTYTLTQTQPEALQDGASVSADAGAVADGNEISSLVVSGGLETGGNNFSETSLKPEYQSIIWFLASSSSEAKMFREVMAVAEENVGELARAAAIRAGESAVPGDTANRIPIAVDDSFEGRENESLIVNAGEGVLSNDDDSDGDALTVNLVSTTSQGVLTLAEDGSFTYTPDADFNGTDSFEYEVFDGTDTSNVAVVTINVSATTNSPPASTADLYTAAEDTTFSVPVSEGVLANDRDNDGDSLTATLVSTATHGGITLAEDGSFVYSPNSNYSGIDSFRYQANDREGSSAITTVTINVVPANDAPTASDDLFEVGEDETLSLTRFEGVLSNDSDVDGNDLNAEVRSTTANGSLTLNADGSLTYTPNADFNGTDSFSYAIRDGEGAVAEAQATINVTAINDPPIATDDAYATEEDRALAVDAVLGVLANDTDIEADTFTGLLVDPPSHGSLAWNADGSFEYLPDADFAGTDSFTYRADDGIDTSELATVNIQVDPVDDQGTLVLPTEFSDPDVIPTRSVGELISFAALVEDIDDDDYIYQLDLEASGIPAGEALPTIDPTLGEFRWTPTVTGRFEIRILVVNGDGEANQETFTIDILSDSEVGNNGN